MLFFCTGVGQVQLASSMLALMMGVKSTSSKLSMPLGTSVPVASTGMSSYLSKLIPDGPCPVPNSSSSTLSFLGKHFVQSSAALKLLPPPPLLSSPPPQGLGCPQGLQTGGHIEKCPGSCGLTSSRVVACPLGGDTGWGHGA